MRKMVPAILFITTMLGSLTSLAVYAKSEEECHQSKKTRHNDLAPVYRFDVTPRFCYDRMAFGFLGEIGKRQNRFNGTMGLELASSFRTKFTGEILNQALKYNFSSGAERRWMQQYAFGAACQFDIDSCGFQTLDFGGSWSEAPTRKLRPHQCNSLLFLHRRIAGSTSYSVNGGFSVCLWSGASVTAAIVYDHVKYKVKFHGRKEVDGFGSILDFKQRLGDNFYVNLKAECRTPYDYFEGSINWKSQLWGGDVTLGAFGGYTDGRHKLPNSSVAGLEIGFDFGDRAYKVTESDGCDLYYPPGCGESVQSGPVYCRQEYEFLEWLAKPAVYMPEVLAVADQKFQHIPPPVHRPFGVPYSLEIPSQFFTYVNAPLIFDVSSYFKENGALITFTSTSSHAGFNSIDYSINPKTGLITISNLSIVDNDVGVIEATVTGTTKYGSTTQSFFIFIFGDNN